MQKTDNKIRRVNHRDLEQFIISVFDRVGVCKSAANYVSEGLVQTSLRGVDSHGVRLFPHYLRGVQGGRINPQPKYKFTKTSHSTGLFDADHTFGHAAGMEAAEKAIGLANKAGSGHVAIYNSTHFGAAAYYALKIANHDMIGMCFTNTDALIRTYAGKRPFLGNNPICFAAPCADEEPFCLDMATSVITFNKVRQLREAKKKAPYGVGANNKGIETINPDEISMLLPISGHKGYGLSMAVEILCGLLTGMPYGPHIPKMFEAPMNQRRYLGQFVIAIKIDCFQNKHIFKKRLSAMMKELRGEPPLKKGTVVRVAGDPEKTTHKERIRKGIPMSVNEHEEFKKIGIQHGISFR